MLRHNPASDKHLELVRLEVQLGHGLGHVQAVLAAKASRAVMPLWLADTTEHAFER